MPLTFVKVLACLIVLLSSVDNAYSSGSSVAAVVNGELISSFELESRVKPLLKANANKQSQEVKAIYKTALDEIIQEEILVQEARKSGYGVPRDMLKAETANRISATKQSEKQFFANLEKQGTSREAFERQVERQILISQLINQNVLSKIVITDNDILEYYKEFETAFGNAMEYNISLIIYPSNEEAQKYGEKVQNKKEDFATVAKDISVGPQAEEGGNIGFMLDKDMSNEILYYVQNMQVGQITSIINIGTSKAQVMLVAKRDSTQEIVIDNAMKQNITEILAKPKRDERYNAYINQINKKALVDIRYE